MAENIQNDLEFNAKEFKKSLGFENKFVITYIGAHGIANHLIQLIYAAEKLEKTNVVFQFIGDGMQKDFLINEVKIKKLKNVIFREPVPKKEVFKYILASDIGAAVLKKADAFKTIFSNKTFDYMSCRKPILLAIDGVSRHLIKDSGSGLYVEPENINSIVSGINRFTKMSDVELLKMGNSGYEYSKKHFDRKILAKQYLTEMSKLN